MLRGYDIFLIILFLSVEKCVSGFSHAKHFNPHNLPDRKTWFEGWYTRFTAENGNSVGVIVGQYGSLNGSKDLYNIESTKLVSLLIQNQNINQLRVVDVEPKSLDINRDGCPRSSKFACFNIRAFEEGRVSFEWNVLPNSSQFWNVELHEGNEVYALRAEASGLVPWSKRLNPEDISSSLIPLHWYVHTVNSPSKFSLVSSERFLNIGTSKSWAHEEKNWGNYFPRKWIWLQATDGASQIVLSGGELFKNVPSVHLLKLRVGNEIDLVWNQFTTFLIRLRYDSSSGSLTASAYRGIYFVQIRAYSNPDSFDFCSCPTMYGFRKYSIESYKSSISVKIYRGMILKRELTFYNAALEFGGDEFSV